MTLVVNKSERQTMSVTNVGGQTMGRFRQRPTETITYEIDYSIWIADSETVSNVAFEISPATTPAAEVIGVTIQNGNTVLFQFDNGVEGTRYSVQIRATTSTGQIKDDVFSVTVGTFTTEAAQVDVTTLTTQAFAAQLAAEVAQDGAESARDQAVAAATTATTAASAASTSATNSATSATNSATSAASSADSATNSANSATSSASSATTATTKAGEASTSATNAANSATTATTKAGEASTSATNAANSATTATTKANEAAASATSAAASAATATTKASEASTSATNAASSATAANNSATAAQTSATNAATKATEASGSASSASLSATNAASSASAASAQASSAATSATTATTSATNAGNSASAAATSATNAATSATNAANSATSAATSATTATTRATEANAAASSASTSAANAASSATAANAAAVSAGAPVLQTLTDEPAIIWNITNGKFATVTLRGNRTLFVSNFKAGETYKLIVFQDTTGGRTLAYDPSFKWPNDVVPTMSTGANSMTVIEFVSNGTYMYGQVTQAYDGSPAPTVMGMFARPATDYSTLLTLTSMPAGGSISRAGNAMYYDSTGKLTYAPNNLVLNSQSFNSWQKIGATVTSAFGVAPDGTSTADRLQFASGVSYLYQAAQPVGPKVIISVWVKSNTGGNQTFRLFGNGTGSNSANLTATTSWQRFSFLDTSTGGTSCGLMTDSSSNAADLLIWGAQVRAVTYQTAETSDLSTYYPTTSAAYYGPRFDVDPATLQPKGLLVEGARSNLLTYSEDFSNAAWTAGAVTFSTPTNASPAGGATSQLLSETATTAFHRVFRLPVTASGAATASVYAKASGRNFIYINLNDAANTPVVAFFDILNGTVVSSGSGMTAKIQSVGGGWYRCSATLGSAYVGSNTLIIGLSSDGTTTNYLGSTASGVYLFGAQLEQTNFASSYIPTQASTASRVVDTFTLTGYANRLVEAYWIEQETGVASSFPETVVSSGAVTINPPQFGWVTSLRAYTNAYSGDIATPSWIDNSGTVGNRMLTDSTGTLTWAPANTIRQSNGFTTTPWSTTADAAVAVTAATTDPFGGNNAFKLYETSTTNAYHTVSQNSVGPSTVGVTFIMSMYVKAAERTQVGFQFNDAGSNKYPILSIPVGAGGSVTKVVDNGIGTNWGFVDAGNGWYRIWIIVTGGGSNTYIAISTSITTTTAYAGTVNSGIYIYGLQLEPVTYQQQPRAYIPSGSAAVFLPRYDFDGSTTPASPRGMLIEETRTNILTNTQDFDAAAWTKTRLNTTGTPAWVNVATAPDGTMTADKLIEEASGSSHFASQSVTVTNGATYTYSIYAKAAERGFLALYCINTNAALNTFFNLRTGVIVSTSAGATAAITPVGNGWYRCSVTTTTTSTTSGIYPGISPDGVNASYTGDGVSGIFVWGAQVELGAFATSYVPNLASSGTSLRVADNVNGLTASISYNAVRGTFGIQFLTSYSGVADTPRYMLALDSNSNKRIAFLQTGADTARTFDGATTVTSTGDVTGAASRVFMAFDEAATARSIVSNGGTVATGTVAAGFGTASTINIGRLGSNQICGWVQSFAYYNSRLPDATLKSKSTVGTAY